MAGPVDMANLGLKSDYTASGPIAGIIAAQQMQDWMDAQGRNFRNNDLSYESDKNKYENDILDNPVKAAKRSNDLSAMGLEDELYKSGDMRTAAKAKVEEQIQKSLTGKTEGQLKEYSARMDWAQQAYQTLEDEGADPLSGQRNKDRYENQILPHAKLIGAAKGLPTMWGPEARTELERRSNSAVQTGPQIQKMIALKAQTDSQERIANIRAEQSGANTALLAGKPSALPDNDRQIEATIGKYKSAGVPVPESLVQELRTVYKNDTYSKGDRQEVMAVASAAETKFNALSPELQQKKLKEAGLPPSAGVDDYRALVGRRERERKENEWVADRLGSTPIQKDNGTLVTLSKDGKERPVNLPVKTPTAATPATGKKPPGKYTVDGKPGYWDGTTFTPDSGSQDPLKRY